MKTIRQWLETIADKEIREKAIRYAENESITTLHERYDTLDYALLAAFWFDKTDEGFEYWENIAAQAKTNTLKTIEG